MELLDNAHFVMQHQSSLSLIAFVHHFSMSNDFIQFIVSLQHIYKKPQWTGSYTKHSEHILHKIRNSKRRHFLRWSIATHKSNVSDPLKKLD
jgi:hypothetical protein